MEAQPTHHADPREVLRVETFTEGEIASVDLAEVRAKLVRNRAAIGKVCFERTDVVHGANVALLATEHVLLLGPPGVAKSFVARTWAAQFEVSFAEYMLTRQTAETDVLHYFDVPAFMAGTKVHRYDGMVTAAQIAFLDEAYKGPQIVNGMLAWLNERKLPGGGASPLLTCILASNEGPESTDLSAFDDRLVVRFWVERLADRGNRLALIRSKGRGQARVQLEQISFLEITAAQRAVAALPVDDLAANAILDVQDSLCAAQIEISDRRAQAATGLCQAHAWLDGSPQVEIDHVDFLRNVLWRRPEDRPAVDAAIGAVNRGVLGEIRTGVERILAHFNEQRARADFPSRAWETANYIKDQTAVLTAAWKDKVPPRLRPRANDYFGELRQAFEQAKAASALTT
jgi:MoxR-like ATPase